MPSSRSILASCVVVLAGCGSSGGPSGTGTDAAVHDGAVHADAPATHDATVPVDAFVQLTDLQFCVAETDRYRATVAKPALAEATALETYAATGAMIDTQAMMAHKHFSDTQGGGISFAENECPSFLGWTVMGTVHDTLAACIAAFWSEGPGGGHYENMIGNYGTLGCGVYLDGTGGITITQDYGQ